MRGRRLRLAARRAGHAGASGGERIVTGLGRFVTGLGACGIMAVGTAAWLWPRPAARAYGVPVDGDAAPAYVRACAARDLVMGAFLLWAAVLDEREAMHAGLLFCTIAPCADLTVVLKERGVVAPAFVHAAGIAGTLGAYALLRLEAS